jgi:ATP-binding cassette subfamily D (ALD) long-chain fatty acid import protein
MFAYKDMLELAGLTTRLYTLVSTLHNLPQSPEGNISIDDSIEIRNVSVTIPGSSKFNTPTGLLEVVSLLYVFFLGKLDEDTPPLVKDLSFIVQPGEHLMITGSNGVGKTAIARVLAGLWRPSSNGAEFGSPSGPQNGFITPEIGAVYAPQGAHDHRHPSIFVVPQRAYMVVGSLLDQVIYPHTYQEFVKSGRTIDELEDILEKVFLTYLPDREGGWNTRKEWRDVLSGGEKQRVWVFVFHSSLVNEY